MILVPIVLLINIVRVYFRVWISICIRFYLGHYQTLHWSTSTRDPRHIWENNSWIMDLWVHWPWTFLYLDMYMFWVNMMTGTTEIFSICQPQQNGIRFSDIFKYIWNSLLFWFKFHCSFITENAIENWLKLWIGDDRSQTITLTHEECNMMTSSMETFSALLALCAGYSPVTGEFHSQRPVTQSFDVFFDLRLDKHLNKQSWGWLFETPSCSLWRHCNDTMYICIHDAIY